MMRSRRRRLPVRTGVRASALALAVVGLAFTCPGSGPDCSLESAPVALSDGLEESSGVAPSRAYPGIVWTHVDGGAPYLYAVDRAGGLVGKGRSPGGRVDGSGGGATTKKNAAKEVPSPVEEIRQMAPGAW